MIQFRNWQWNVASWLHIWIWIHDTWFSQIPKNVKGSSDEFIDANIQLALAVVRKLRERKETRTCIVSIIFAFLCMLLTLNFGWRDVDFSHSFWIQVFPDKPEKRRASELFKAALDSVTHIADNLLDLHSLSSLWIYIYLSFVLFKIFRKTV